MTLLLLPAALCPGLSCRDFGTGGTGEIVVPRDRLRTIEQVELADLSSSPPTTMPATLPTTLPATAPAEVPEVAITLEEVRQMALANNLDVQVELLSPTIARESLSEVEAQFESLFRLNSDYGVSDTPTASQLAGSNVKDLSISPGLVLPLRTGGTVQLAVPMSRLETNNQFSTLNPAYTSDVSASISHPLLRGAGIAANSHRIRVAFYDYQISQARTKLEIIRVLAAAERVYWRLYAARRELEVRRKEYDLAVAQLERARRLVDAGQAAQVEIVRAESGVADTIEAIINAENAVRDRQRELKRVLNQPGLEMNTRTVLIPATLPNALQYSLDADRLVDAAMKHRMEMLELELRIAQETSSVAFARNDTLPLVVLDYTYNVNGLGPGWDESFNMVSDKNFEDHRLGLRMEVPIGNEAARSRLRRALATRLQTLTSRQQRAMLITQEVLNALDQLQANWQRILATRQRTILAARLLDAEVRQFELGLRTSTEVLAAQANLANAQSAEIAAITEYQISQVDIAFATGMLLGQAKVSWAPTPVPKR
ncbi:TolC family protein [Fontivita pretiosa]|uniref:TolC family protein n=1 Tax=Fontivita pretiosa TaxID=2989684 RepID=UPI003D183624